MTWAIFYLVCFLVGVTLSVLSFLGGSFHLPHFHVHVPHAHMPHGRARTCGRPGQRDAVSQLRNDHGISGVVRRTGYLLTRYSSSWSQEF